MGNLLSIFCIRQLNKKIIMFCFLFFNIIFTFTVHRTSVSWKRRAVSCYCSWFVFFFFFFLKKFLFFYFFFFLYEFSLFCLLVKFLLRHVCSFFFFFFVFFFFFFFLNKTSLFSHFSFSGRMSCVSTFSRLLWYLQRI